MLVGKTNIQRGHILVTRYGEKRYASVEVFGILPKCRKVQLLTMMPGYRGIWVRPLFGHNGVDTINPEEWRVMLQSMPVMADRHGDPIEITPDVEAWARAHVESICDCPAVCNP